MRTYQFSEVCVAVFHQLDEGLGLVFGVGLKLELGKLTGSLAGQVAVFKYERNQVQHEERRGKVCEKERVLEGCLLVWGEDRFDQDCGYFPDCNHEEQKNAPFEQIALAMQLFLSFHLKLNY